MKYSADFSQQAKASVEAEKILATQDLPEQIGAARYPSDVKDLVKNCILRIVAAFANEACQLGFQGTWAADYIEDVVLDALRHFTIEIEYSYAHGITTSMIETGFTGAYITTKAMQEFRQSKEWKKYQSTRLKVARAQAKGDGRISNAEQVRNPVLSEQAKDALKTARTAIWEGYDLSFPEKVYIADVCWAAKQRRREWTRWRSGELKDGSKPDRAFRAVLTSKKRPEEYRPEPRPKEWK